MDHKFQIMLFKTLKKYFGYDEFRPLQKEIIQDVLHKKDVVVLMPTGGGKSMCYQLPSVLMENITIVISPLISLMKDQVDSLKKMGIQAAYLNSTLDYSEKQNIEKRLINNTLDILYVAPERFANDEFMQILKNCTIDLIAIDEAHCISEWGHDFRPDYRNLSTLKHIFSAPIMALTATATNRVVEDIVSQLSLKNHSFYRSSFDRKNLRYFVKDGQDTYLQILSYIKQKHNWPGIIYTFSRKEVEELSRKLREDGIKALPYHAGLSDSDRTIHQEQFINDDIQIIVATLAFGMGIDKSNVRFVIHKNIPSSIERYYQETGRAGRDGLESECLLFYNYADKSKIEYFINQKTDELERNIAAWQMDQMIQFSETSECRRKILLNYFNESYETQTCNACDNCLQPKETFDATIISQKILSCIVKLHGRFGQNYVSKILTGSRDKTIIRNRHTQLSVYGIVNEYSAKDVARLIRLLYVQGYLKKEGDRYPTLNVTKKAKQSLQQRSKIFLPLIKKSIIAKSVDSNYDSALFEVLRTLRKRIATKEGIAPYQVFSDMTLKLLCQDLPRTELEFGRIKGIGEYKLNRYGTKFLKEIYEYLKQNKTRNAKKRGITSTLEETLELYKKGLSISQIAQKRTMAQSTIAGHLEKLYLNGSDIDIYRFISEETLSKIEEVFKSLGKHALKPTKDTMGSSVTYDEIRFVRAKLQREDKIVYF